MSVFTKVDTDQLQTFLQQFDCGELIEHRGIAAGIENTNYFVTTTGGRFVLTLFENHGADELPFFLDLMAYLAEHDIPTAHPVPTRDGAYLTELNDRPAALVQRLTGGSLDHPDPAACAEIGRTLARFHRVSADFPEYRAPDRDLAWAEQVAVQLDERAKDDERALLADELAFQRGQSRDGLPRGAIHADLFRDNALFEDGELTGIIDLYYACTDAFAYDLAVTLNDWCVDESGHSRPAERDALLAAYLAERPFTAAEQAAWPGLLRAAALRFWVSRMQDQYFPRAAEMTYIKDPAPFRRILEAHREAGANTDDWISSNQPRESHA
ncbi:MULTISPECIES: homoserine kinase [unclassified Guyparkeria]|uniref:homoserine kinase n=1 Tax=unclassified Guyparkeria TaxID=2626246 RepID=UPI0007334A6F|nr:MULTISPECIES: homoserine kinase [unclassified Guyparkeria]KTG15958.1 homoserine kinase [Guyparkeria sp. XI15]OAE84713.1 homoserine kinase [Guyparkeria sp. WRN-7]